MENTAATCKQIAFSTHDKATQYNETQMLD